MTAYSLLILLILGCTAAKKPLSQAPVTLDLKPKSTGLTKINTEPPHPLHPKFEPDLYLNPRPPRLDTSAIQAISDEQITSAESYYQKRDIKHTILAIETKLSQFSYGQNHEQKREDLLTLVMLHLENRSLKKSQDVLQDLEKEIASAEILPLKWQVRHLYVLAMLACADHKLDLARDHLRQILKKDESYTPAYEGLARIYLLDDRVEIAKKIIAIAKSRQLESGELYHIEGQIEHRQGELFRAKSLYEKALELKDSTSFDISLNLARLYLDLNDLKVAKSLIQEVLKISPLFEHALVLHSLTLEKNHQIHEAMDTLRHCLNHHPHSVLARYHLALMIISTKQNDHEALQLLQEVTQSTVATPQIKQIAHTNLSHLFDIGRI